MTPIRAERDLQGAVAAVPMLSLDGVSKSFPGVRALDGVSLRL